MLLLETDEQYGNFPWLHTAIVEFVHIMSWTAQEVVYYSAGDPRANNPDAVFAYIICEAFLWSGAFYRSQKEAANEVLDKLSAQEAEKSAQIQGLAKQLLCSWYDVHPHRTVYIMIERLEERFGVADQRLQKIIINLGRMIQSTPNVKVLILIKEGYLPEDELSSDFKSMTESLGEQFIMETVEKRDIDMK